MKIAVIAWSLSSGGIERVASVLTNRMIDDNHEVSIITLSDNKEGVELYNDKIKMIHLSSGFNNRVIRPMSKILELRRYIKKKKYDVLIPLSFGIVITTIIARGFSKVKTIGSERTDPSKEPNSRIMKLLRNIAYSRTSKMIFQTDEAKNYFSKKVQQKGVVIPNPIHDNLPIRDSRLSREKIMVNFCRLVPQKNLFLLIDSFFDFCVDYPEYKLVIYGRGPLEKELRDYINKIGLAEKIEIYDFTTEIHLKIINCAMFVSSSDYEGISNSMLEAMALGIPTISTDCPVGGARLVIENMENGILTTVGSRKELTDAMKYVVNNPVEAEIMANRAIEIRNQLSSSNIVQRWYDVIFDDLKS